MTSWGPESNMPETTPPSRPSKSAKTPASKEIWRSLSKVAQDWKTWEPETLWAELKRDGWTLTETLKGKIQAIKTVLASDAFWKDHLAFEKVVMALNDRPALFDQYQHPSPAMIARALREVASIALGTDFSDEVARYAAVVCFEAGMVALPQTLRPFQESLDELTAPIVGRKFREDVDRRWAERQSKPEGLYAETETGIQLARMAAVEEYAAA